MQMCKACGELGIVRLKSNGAGDEALCYCGCVWSRAQVWKLPTLNAQIEEAFQVSRCPLTWFLPDNERASVPRGRFIASMGPIVQKWRERVKQAEKFWAEYGALFEPTPKFWNEAGER